MDSKLKGLRTLLIIGTIIVFLAGFAFLFANSVSAVLRVSTMLLISIVLMGLSLYEENKLNLKKDSIISYIIGNVGILVAYISCYGNHLFGVIEEGTPTHIFTCIFFVLLGILLIIAMFKYKLYKLLEMSIFSFFIALMFILKALSINNHIVMIIILSIILIKNIFKISEFSLIIALVFSFISYIYLGVIEYNNIALVYVVGILGILNCLLLMYKNKDIQIIPTIIMSIIIINLFVGIDLKLSVILTVALFVIIETLLKLFNVINDNKELIIKIIFNIFYVEIFIDILGLLDNVYFLVPCILLVSGIINAYLLKDPYEQYTIPFRLLYFITQLVGVIPYDGMDYIEAAIINITMLVAFLYNKNNKIKLIYAILLFLVSAATFMNTGADIIQHIIHLILFGIDFYAVYVSKEKYELGLNIVFGVFAAIILFTAKINTNITYMLAISILYALYMAITKKNKFIFGVSLLMFVVASSSYVYDVIAIENISLLIIHLLVLCGIILFGYVVTDNDDSQIMFTSISVMCQMLMCILNYGSLLLRVFALIEALGLIVFAINKNKRNLPYVGGIVFTIISLLSIMATFDNIPTAFYLIIIGLSIVIIVPIMINKYINKVSNETKEEIKTETKNEKKQQPKESVSNDDKYCSQCGNKISNEFKFCNKCGNKLK